MYRGITKKDKRNKIQAPLLWIHFGEAQKFNIPPQSWNDENVRIRVGRSNGPEAIYMRYKCVLWDVGGGGGGGKWEHQKN